MDYPGVTEYLVKWLQDKAISAGAKGYCVGISGGIDSAVSAALCKRAFPHATLGLLLPCNGSQEDLEDGLLLANSLELKYKIIDLNITYESFLQAFQTSCDKREECRMAYANVKPRLRMAALYFAAGQRNYLVVGTGNKAEIEIGYYTKFGDGGVDLEPIGDLTKTEVWELASFLGIPNKLISKVPTAGLWEAQTDEQEMGFSYRTLDAYLTGAEIDQVSKAKIELLHQYSEHKRNLPEVPILAKFRA